MNYREIEHAFFSSWPALEQISIDDWVIRYANGYTKRANSANVLSYTEGNLLNKIKACEDFYRNKGIPSIFRLLSVCDNSAMEGILEKRGYDVIDRTLVLYQDLEGKAFPPVPLKFRALDDWIYSFCNVTGGNPAEQSTHLEILRLIEAKCSTVVVEVNNREVSCGIGVISNGYFGIFDIETEKHLRNRGFGSKLLQGMLQWAICNGASKAYVQVVATNAPAIHLYQKLGYISCYEYWYRVKRNGK